MPTYIIKPEPNRNFYILWSTITDSPTAWGDRAEIEGYLIEDGLKSLQDRMAPRFLRADGRGTSVDWGNPPFFGGWNDEGLMYEQRGILPRRHLTRVTELLEAGDASGVWDLLEPFEDGAEVRRG